MEYTDKSHHKIRMDAQTGTAVFSCLNGGAPLLPIPRESGVSSIRDGCINGRKQSKCH